MLRFSSAVSQLLFMLTVSMMVESVGGVCPECCGNLIGCSWDTDGKCPLITVIAANTELVGGRSTAAGAMLTLTGIVSLRFLRLFTSATLSALLKLVKRGPRIAFELKKSTTLQAALTAISNGQITYEEVLIGFAQFADEESAGDAKTALMLRYEMVAKAKEIGKISLANANADDMGVYSWLWAKCSEFVVSKGMETTVSIDLGNAASGANGGDSTNVLKASLKHFGDWWSFMECLNLFLLFATALGITSTVVLAEFYESFVYDNLRLRGYSWQFCACLVYIVFRHIEESAGTITLATAADKIHLNSVFQEAEAAVKRHYPGAGIFRAHPGKGGNDTTPGGDTVQWNGKHNASSKKLCNHFNWGRDHPAGALQPDGTCKGRHACDAWVSNKGKEGKCLNSAGTPGHGRHNCDNPNRCDGPAGQ